MHRLEEQNTELGETVAQQQRENQSRCHREVEELGEAHADRWKRGAVQRVRSHPERHAMDGAVATMDVRFDKREHPQKSPKMHLLEWSRRAELEQPVYETAQRPEDRAFQSTVTVTGRKYRSTQWEKSKKLAEQAAAVVCLRILEVPDGEIEDEHREQVWEREASDHMGHEVDDEIAEEGCIPMEVLRRGEEDMKRTEEPYNGYLEKVQAVIKTWEHKQHPTARFLRTEVRCRDCN